MRACRFSSVESAFQPANAGFSISLYVEKASSIGIVIRSMERFLARAQASSRLSFEEYSEGIKTPVMFSGPSAAQATAATSEESIPPLRPMTTWEKPFFLT